MGVPPEELTEVVLVLKAAKKGKYHTQHQSCRANPHSTNKEANGIGSAAFSWYSQAYKLCAALNKDT